MAPSPRSGGATSPRDANRQFGAGAALAGGALVSSNPAWVWPWGDDPTID